MSVVNNKLPLSTTTSDDFNELIHTASHLTIGTYIPITNKQKMDYLLVQMFASFITDVRALIAATRALFVYDSLTKDVNDVDACINNPGLASTHRGWIIVCHDGWWDSTLKQFFGVSIFFINPSTWVWYQLALGLATPDGHSAEKCAEAVLQGLDRYGIGALDIYVSVNKTLPLLWSQAPVVPWLERMATV